MNKVDALDKIKDAWTKNNISLEAKINSISSCFFEGNLDLCSTASFIKATESELAAILNFSFYDDKIIKRISSLNPPKTVWTILSSANEDELIYALDYLESHNKDNEKYNIHDSDVYNLILEYSGPTIEQKVGNLSNEIINVAIKKGIDFKIFNEKDISFMKSIALQRYRGKKLSIKQITAVINKLNKLVDNGAIVHNSIDGDEEACEIILNALER